MCVRLKIGGKMSLNNKKIIESKRKIKEEKKKIKIEKANIRKKRSEKFRATKIGSILYKVFGIFDFKKDGYSFSQVFMVTLISLGLGFFACYSFFAIFVGNRNLFKLSKDLSKFFDVYDVLLENYYGEVDKNELIDEAINGMVSSVGDTYTSYVDTDKTDEFNQMVEGKYEGIGCLISQLEDKAVIISVYEGSPAQKAGILEGDNLVTVDGMDVLEKGVSKISDYIKGEAKGTIELTILRGEEEKQISLKRGEVEIPSVGGKVIERNNKKIGYIDISIFSSVSAPQFEKKLKELETDGIDGLVVDVRDNNGGYLSAVTDILSNLLPKGNKIYQIQKGDDLTVYKDKTSEKREYPIAVITNGASASASEIFAGAIKESYLGYVVGTRTYGKGTVQQVKKLSDGSMIKYTVENWLTPEGNWINEKGIEPTDEVILNDEYYKTYSEEDDNQLQKAVDLVGK